MKLKRIDEIAVGDQFEIGTILVEVVNVHDNLHGLIILALEPIMRTFTRNSMMTLIMAKNYKLIIIAEGAAHDPEPA
jgi:hypothetical protein